MADGTIRINTRIDSKDFNAGIKAMMGGFASIAKVAGVALSIVGITAFTKASIQAAAQSESAWQGLKLVVNANSRSFDEAKGFIENYVSDGLVPLLSAIKSYQNMISRGYTITQLENMLMIMKDSAVFARQGQFSIGEAIEKTTQGLRMENSLLTDSVGIQTNVAKMWAKYANEIGTTVNRLTHAQKLQAEYNGFIREGGVFSGAAAQYLTTYAGRVSQLSAAYTNLKIAVGNAFIPILNALLPSVIKLVNWFTRLFNIIGRVINLLLGTNVGAKDAADSTSNLADEQRRLADETERAGKAAKGALAPFDKLNVLAQNTGSGGGVGDTEVPGIEIPAPETNPFIEAIDELEEKIRSFVEKLKRFFAPLGEAFSRLGQALGSLWEAVENAFSIFFPNGIDFEPFIIALRDGVIFFIGLLAKVIQGFANWINENPEAFRLLLTIFVGLAAAFLLAYAPGVLLAGAIIALIALIGVMAQNCSTIVSAFKVGWENVTNWAADTVNKIINFFKGIPNWFDTKIIQPVVNFFKGLWQSVSGFFVNLWSDIVGIWTSVSNWFNSNVVEPVVGSGQLHLICGTS